MEIKPIKTDADHEAALREIEELWGVEGDTPNGDRLDILIALVSAYEDRHHAIDSIDDPIEFLSVYLEATNRTQADLAILLGSRPRASEILNRKRRLTTEMIYRISSEWGVPAELLVKPYELAA